MGWGGGRGEQEKDVRRVTSARNECPAMMRLNPHLLTDLQVLTVQIFENQDAHEIRNRGQ